MYNEDDAVAKLDGYIVSVSGAGGMIGERTMVRIEKVDRSAAQASLVDPPPEREAEEGQGSGRRRGRRGGRGRRKPAESSS